MRLALTGQLGEHLEPGLRGARAPGRALVEERVRLREGQHAQVGAPGDKLLGEVVDAVGASSDDQRGAVTVAGLRRDVPREGGGDKGPRGADQTKRLLAVDRKSVV